MHRHAGRFAQCGYSVRDADVKPAHLGEMINTGHPCDALLTLWSENTFNDEPFFTELSELGVHQGYGVMESTPLPIKYQVGRVEGWCQIAFIRKPNALSRQNWLAAWLGDHTQIAIDTQANFGYRQNVVTSTLPYQSTEQLSKPPKWPTMDAIVEENFPNIAMTSREAFFAAENNPDKFNAHQQIMMRSCAKFIDFDAFDCVPMSQYIVKI